MGDGKVKCVIENHAMMFTFMSRQAGMSIGWKGMLYAARRMAEGTKLLMEKPEN